MNRGASGDPGGHELCVLGPLDPLYVVVRGPVGTLHGRRDGIQDEPEGVGFGRLIPESVVDVAL